MTATVFLAPLGGADWTLLAAAPFIGSFIGVVIRRLPEGAPLGWARSRCEHCGTVLAPRDLVPLVSWLVARGRCRHCGQRLGWFYPGVEASVFALALVSLSLHRGAAAWLDFLLGCWLLALGWIDLRRWLLPDALTLPLILVGFLAAWLVGPATLLDSALGAGCGYLGLRAVAAIFRRARGLEGIGGGDMKLLGAAGAWVGLSGLPSVLLGAAGAALLVAGGLALAGIRLDRHTALPFGPFLGLAIWLVWLLGPIRI
jgi:leader peptidase (prepilin peptidase)/N-methyltransferase